MTEDLGDALRLLRARGFSPAQSRPGERCFRGALACGKGPVRVSLVISDWEFLTYPKLQILERPDFLPTLMPHVDVFGGLCYFAPGSVILDRYHPATAIAQCLDQATALVDRIAADPGYRSADIQDEFLSHWEFGQTARPWPVLLGPIEPDAQSANYSFIEVDGTRRAIICSNPGDVEALAHTFGTARPSETRCKCWLFRTARRPAVPLSLPQTVNELFPWLSQWDPTLYQGIQRMLGREKSYLQYKFVTFAVDTPAGWLGFGFDLDQVTRLATARRPKIYRQYLHGRGGPRKLLRLSITDVSDRFVHSRNLSFPDLRDKDINVVGCGSIGSFLAQSLVRLGAGTGSGTLTLIDPDDLQPENLGRHLLGYPSLFQPKASALAAELGKLFPFCRIDPVTRNAFDHCRLFAADLIIDATGEEAVSERLNGVRLDRRARVPVLHVWIKGNGESVQALWTDSSGGGCFRCLKTLDPGHYRQERFPVLKQPPERRHVGCHAFTPYAVSAPMQAAALATDVVCAWMKGRPDPKFRTRSVESADVRLVKNQNIGKLEGCPACDRR